MFSYLLAIMNVEEQLNSPDLPILEISFSAEKSKRFDGATQGQSCSGVDY